MQRNTGTPPSGHAIYFINICGRKQEPRGTRAGGAKDGPGGLADTVLAKGQWVREDSQHLRTAPCAPLSPCLSRYLLLQPF